MMAQKNIVGRYLVPGMPHILMPEYNRGYEALNQAMKRVGEDLLRKGAERIFYYSTQWLSVLGLSFQGRPHITGQHVDENWHDFGDLTYQFHTDTLLTQRLAECARRSGYQANIIDYDHFPIDTATIVADKLINPSHLKVGMMASHVYSNFDKTQILMGELEEVIGEDGIPTALVAIGLTTTNYHAKSINLKDDVLDSESEQWNHKLLNALEDKGIQGARAIIDQTVRSTRTDMGLKSLAFLAGGAQTCKANIFSLESLYGAGAAVVSFENCSF